MFCVLLLCVVAVYVVVLGGVGEREGEEEEKCMYRTRLRAYQHHIHIFFKHVDVVPVHTGTFLMCTQRAF